VNALLFIPIGYLVGAIPFSFLIARAAGVDLRAQGSGNPGATNLGRVLGRRYFVAGFALDMTKGLTPTLLAGWALGTLGTMDMAPRDAWVWLAVMAACVLGHMFTPFLGFRGGKGVATGLGAMLGIMPAMTLPVAGVMLVFAVTLLLWRMVGVASPVAAASLPLWVYMSFSHHETLRERQIAATPRYDEAPAGFVDEMVPNHALPFFVVSLALAILVIYKHAGNLARALRGQEPRIGQKPREAQEPAIGEDRGS